MKHFNGMKSLLFAFVCAGVLVNNVSANLSYPRLSEVPAAVMKEGCWPLAHQMCPALMQCWLDLKFPKFGQCTCNTVYGLKLKPPSPVEPGSEIARLPHKSDCVGIGPVNFFFTLYQFFIAVVCLIVAYGSLKMIIILIKKKVFKGNSSCIGLIASFICALGSGLRSLIHVLYHASLDPNELFRTLFHVQIDSIAAIAICFLVFESSCTWFDLWQKSIKMSKTSSRAITVIRNTLRIWGFLIGLSFFLINFGLVPSGLLGFWAATQNSGQYSMFAVNAVIGPLLARVLCKNMKDVTNPNWKAASAIRITACHGALLTVSFNLGIQLILRYGIFNIGAPHVNVSLVEMLWMYNAVHCWSWYQYLQFAHRRHMGDVTANRISNYFGFTTLGLKGSGAESSVASQRSSIAASSASSAVSSTSVAASSSAEESGDTNGKGTMA